MSSWEEEFGHLRIGLEDIQIATNNFSAKNVIGAGGLGKTYKGELLILGKGSVKQVAIKRLEKMYVQGDLEFWNEVMLLSRFKHENIVSLVGFCNDRGERILIYEFLSRGSLDQYLSDADLTWLVRLQICLGAARGLTYLHNPHGTKLRILHRDVKSANIILDENWHAKMSDIGLSKMAPANQQFSFLVSGPAGTFGYVDPVYVHTGILTKESDTYSFGVVLFEVLSGRLAVLRDYDDERRFLALWACRHYEEGTIAEIVDPILRKQMNPDSLHAFSSIAYRCLNREREKRPTMAEVVEELERVLGLQQELEKALALQQDGLEADTINDALLFATTKDSVIKGKVMEHMKIPVADLMEATHDFDDQFTVKQGRYGTVYKADLIHFDLKKFMVENKLHRGSMTELLGNLRTKDTVAIKRLNHTYGQGSEEFLQEICSMLPFFWHQNLVTLVGFCAEGHERILVYEYASNGSLEEYIHNGNRMNNHTWNLCLRICVNAARGLKFLHSLGDHHSIIHRSMKTSNILLGERWEGMISDFGLSIIGPQNLEDTFLMAQIRGTLEYIDPQYSKLGTLTKESDVYSFGVILFEVLSGRLARFQKTKDNPEFVPHMAKRCFEEKKVNEIIDPKLKKEFEKAGSSIVDDETIPYSVYVFATIAYKCIQEKRNDRPTMADIVTELEKALKCHVNAVEALRTSLNMITSATNGFRDVIWKGEFGMVYKGELSHSKGFDTVFVKRFHMMGGSYNRNFFKDIENFYSYSHKNIIPLLGFCDEDGERIAVFKYMANGNLNENVKNTSLTWRERLKICVDAAHGLAYIHNGAGTQYTNHGDVKSSNILLNQDWEAVISDFIITKGADPLGYYHLNYATSSMVTQKSDVYNFGVVLFEILCGRFGFETSKGIQVKHLDALNFEAKNRERGEREDEQVISLARLAAQCFENKRLDEIIFQDIKGQIDQKTLVIFSEIAYQCLQEHEEDQPTMAEVLKQLETALDCQDEWEWEHKLPRNYEEIIKKSKHPVTYPIKKKDIYSLLSSGVLLDSEKVWFSISMDGVTNETVSAKRFSYSNVSSLKWRPVQKSRFPSVAKIFDISNLNIEIKITTQYLTLKKTYGAYLVFKFCNPRKVSSRPLYVNLKYKTAGKTLNAYFAEWKAGTKWLTVELFRFWNHKETTDFEILLESFSLYHCGSGGIFIEGVEFQAIPSNVDSEDSKEQEEVMNVQGLLKSESDKDKGEEGKCHMLPAKGVIHHSLMKFYDWKDPDQSRFAEVVEILSGHEFRIKCDIETENLSLDTRYACFLVFKLSERCRGLKCPVKARDLLPYRKERTKIVSFTQPSIVNLDKIKWIPEEREDGWMEVIVWEIMCDKRHTIPMDLKLICFEGTMSGLIVCGIEFRPMLDRFMYE